MSRLGIRIPETRRGRIAFALLMATAFYAVVLAAYALYRWSRGTPLEWAWWQYAIAPFAIVAAEAASDPVLDKVTAFLAWRNPGNPLWKRAMACAFILLVMASVPLGIWYLQTAYT